MASSTILTLSGQAAISGSFRASLSAALFLTSGHCTAESCGVFAVAGQFLTRNLPISS